MNTKDKDTLLLRLKEADLTHTSMYMWEIDEALLEGDVVSRSGIVKLFLYQELMDGVQARS